MFQPFTERARAKINLALHVLGRRPDGYHELDSIVAFADVGDVLRFEEAQNFSITAEGPFAHALPAPEQNIIARARDAVATIAGAHGLHLPPVAIHLTKNLPVASGVGGGSANAAAALRGFLKIAGVAGAEGDILAAALALGADVPVCHGGLACRMQGIGERITPLERLDRRKIVLVNPGIGVSTASVFGKLGLAPGAVHGSAIAATDDPALWRNDLTEPAIAVAPDIGDVLAALASEPGIADPRMSGSGATCFGYLDGDVPEALAELAKQRGWWLARAHLAFP